MLEDIKNIANILFFVAVGTVGVLTYLHAKKTIFAPLRTETFKLQLKVLEELLLFFQHKGEHDFIEDLDLQRIMTLNTFKMFDSYADNFFKDQFQFYKESRSKIYKPLRYALVKAEDLIEINVKSHRSATANLPPVPDTPALTLARWREYKINGIGYTEEHHKKIKELQRFSSSPLLPVALRSILDRFKTAAEKNLALVGEVITEAAQEMPESFSTMDELRKIEPAWVWNIYNDKKTKLEPIAKELLDFINGYLKIDGLAIPQT